MTTVQDQLIAGLTDLLVTNFLPAVCEYLEKDKGVICTCAELTSALNLTTVNLSLSNISIPRAISSSSLSSVGTPPLSSSVTTTKGKRTTKAKVIDVNVPTCKYEISRGDNKGKLCGKAAVPGTDRCRACAVKGANKSSTASKLKVDNVPLNQGTVYSRENPTLDFHLVDESQKLYREPKYNMLIQEDLHGNYVVRGVLNDPAKDASYRPLNQQEQNYAQNCGFNIAADAQFVSQVMNPTLAPPLSSVAIGTNPSDMSNVISMLKGSMGGIKI